MLTEERFEEIISIVNKRKTITVQELTKLLDTSESTIRRDLNILDKKRKIIKVHGGATSIDLGFRSRDINVSIRQDMNIEEKKIIASYAAKLIENEDFIYIDAGTSTELLIDYIDAKSVVYVTNAIAHAQKLLLKGCKVLLLGGEVKPVTEAIVGGEALESLEKYNFTKGFFGSNGVGKEHGFTTPDIEEAIVKEHAMSKCKKAYVLVDSTKFNQISSVKFAEFESAIIITTDLKDKSFRKYKNIMEVGKA